jgi:branched-chain amino acid aminotransferase
MESFLKNTAVSSDPDRSQARTCWVDGRLMDRDKANLSLDDLAFTRGYAAFEALRTYHRRPFLLDAHLERLYGTCAILGLKVPLEYNLIVSGIIAALGANDFEDSLIRIYVTGGEAAGFAPAGRERLLILVDPLRIYPVRQYAEGVSLATRMMQRSLPLAKSTDYVIGVRETIWAKKGGFDEVAFLDSQSALLEGTTFNIVAVRNAELVTPKEGVLRGITLQHTLKLAEKAGLAIRRAPISPRELARADEMFITSSTREVMPVARVDHTRIGNGRPGPITRLLQEMYQASALALSAGR